jgi:uncharacterized membrane protein (UPF0127 family)
MQFRVTNITRAALLAHRAERAIHFFARLKGLIGRTRFNAGEGLQIEPCNSIHTFFMRFPIDAIFLDEGRKVLRVYPALKPWQVVICIQATSVLELPAGTVDRTGTRTADELEFELC